MPHICWEAEEDGSDSDMILVPLIFAALGLPELEVVCIICDKAMSFSSREACDLLLNLCTNLVPHRCAQLSDLVG